MERSQIMWKIILCVSLILVVFLQPVNAIDVANSKEWQDVYSVLMKTTQEKNQGTFIKSESFTEITKIVGSGVPITLYESSDDPFISGLEGQLSAGGFTVPETIKSDDFALDLDPQTGKYIVIG